MEIESNDGDLFADQLADQLAGVNLSKDNQIPAMSALYDESKPIDEEYNENYMRLVKDYKKTHEWLKSLMMDEGMLLSSKKKIVQFMDKMKERMEYYDEMICFDHEHSAYADLSPDDKQRLVFIYQSLCEAMTELNDWMKKLMSISNSNQEKDQTTKKKMIKKTRIEIAIDKLQTRRNSSALVSASASTSATDGSVRKLRKTLQSIYDFHHLSFEFIHRDSSSASA